MPGKNLRTVGGRALVARAVDSALCAPHIDEVVVSTDHDGIAAVAGRAGARTVQRPATLAGSRRVVAGMNGV